MGRRSYLGGHSIWYSDTARAQNYKTGGGMNFGSGWAGGGSLPTGRYEGTVWVEFKPKELPVPRAEILAKRKRKPKPVVSSASEVLVHDYLRRKERERTLKTGGLQSQKNTLYSGYGDTKPRRLKGR
jgi:hypothetical protein